MNRRYFLRASVSAADIDAADNEHKRNTDIEAKLLRDAFVTFGGQHNFKPRIMVRDNARLFARAEMAAGGTTLASTGMSNRVLPKNVQSSRRSLASELEGLAGPRLKTLTGSTGLTPRAS